MNLLSSIDPFVEEVIILQEDILLSEAVNRLKKGQSAAVVTEGAWKFLSLADTAGYPVTRSLADIPLRSIPVFEPGTTVEQAELIMHRENAAHAFVAEGKTLKGIISLEKLMSVILEAARESGVLEEFLGEALDSFNILVWRIVLPDNPESFSLSDAEVHGSTGKLLGYSSDLFRKNREFFSGRLHIEDRTKLEKAVKKVIESGEHAACRFRFRHRDGHWIWLQGNLSIRRRYDGKPETLYIVSYDITGGIEREEMEKLTQDVRKILSMRSPGHALAGAFKFLGEKTAIDEVIIFLIDSSGVSADVQWVRSDFTGNFKKLYRKFEKKYMYYREKRGESLVLSDSFKKVLETGEAVYIPDIKVLENDNAKTSFVNGVRSYMLFSCAHINDKSILLGIMSRKPDAFTDAQRELFVTLLPSFSAVIEAWHYEKQLKDFNSALEKRVRQRTYELEVLYHLSQSLSYSLNYDELLFSMIKYLSRVINYDVAGTLFELGNEIKFNIYEHTNLSEKLKENIQNKLLERFAELTSLQADSKRITINIIPLDTKSTDKPKLESIKSRFIIPAKTGRDKKVIGLLLVGSADKNAFSKEQATFLQTVANESSVYIEQLRNLMEGEQKRLERIIEHLPEGIYLLDNDFNILSINTKGKELLPFLTGKKSTGKIEHIGDIPLKDITLWEKSPDIWHTVVVDKPRQMVFRAAVFPMVEGPEEEKRMLIIRDVTEESLIQERMKQQELLASVGQMAAGIAHDFNNSLTGIIGFAQYLQTKDDIPAYAKGHLKSIEKQGMRAVNLIQQILDFSRKSVVICSDINLVPLIKEIVKMLERTIPEDIKIQLNIETKDAVIYSDPTQIQQIITNLAVNARDAMPSGGLFKITLADTVFKSDSRPPFPDMKSGRWICLYAEDTGMGIPRDIQTKIFDPFFTTKPVGSGTGLGLSQVYGIVNQNKGHIIVESEPGKGTRFAIYFPAVEKREKSDNEAEPVLNVVTDKTVLLVEDEEVVLKAVKLMLEQLGFKVLSAYRGENALKIIRGKKERIDLILTDIVMPGMGGRALARKIKELKTHIKVIGMSGYPLGSESDGTVDESIKAAALDGWVSKPVTMERLSKTISDILNT